VGSLFGSARISGGLPPAATRSSSQLSFIKDCAAPSNRPSNCFKVSHAVWSVISSSLQEVEIQWQRHGFLSVSVLAWPVTIRVACHKHVQMWVEGCLIV